MEIAADNARDTEKLWKELQYLHDIGQCDSDCPYCNEDFEPLFQFQ